MIFKSDEHQERFEQLCSSYTGNSSGYAFPLFYLMAMDNTLWQHKDQVYNFKDNGINPESLNKDWQTGGSIRALRLGFNLFNGYTGAHDEDTRDYTPDSIFDYGNVEYLAQAIMLRYR